MINLIILEGPDGAGKSTLAADLTRRSSDSLVIHHGPLEHIENLAEHYRQALLGEAKLVIIDRAWTSEPIYSEVYRDGVDRIGTANRRMLERVALGLGAVEIVCLPPLSRCLTAYRSRKSTEYLADESQLIDVYQRYASYAIASPRALPRLIYDRTRTTILELLDEINLYSSISTNHGPGIGRFSTGNVLIVGDRVNDGGNPRHPFVSFNRRGCSTWLTERLEEAGLPEDQLYWVNSRTRDGWLPPGDWLARLAPRKILALGANAQFWAHHVAYDNARVISLPHPSYWRRFHYTELYQIPRGL